MKIEEIMGVIAMLSRSQGFYCRLYQELVEIRDYDSERWELIVIELEKQNFTEALDVVFYFEC